MIRKIFGPVLVGLLSLGAPARARPGADLCAQFRRQFPIVRFMVTERGGFGDVAAAYTTAQALVRDCYPDGKVQIQFNSQRAREVFDRLTDDNPAFLQHVDLAMFGYDRLPQPDLLFDLAEHEPKLDAQAASMVNHTVVVGAPVFSNSETDLPYGYVAYQNHFLRSAPPGLGLEELGSYPDPTAESFRDLSAADLQSRLVRLAQAHDLAPLASILASSARVSLAYGISYGAGPWEYFVHYTLGLKNLVEGKRALVLITPSRLHEQMEKQRGRVELPANWRVWHLESLTAGWQPEAGKINIVETPTLPNSLFVGLMAYSVKNGVVPIGAGDGFLSSAMALRIPFVLTQLPHNLRVMSELGQSLRAYAASLGDSWRERQFRLLVRDLFDSRQDPWVYQQAQFLAEYAPEFAAFAAQSKQALSSWMRLALFVKEHINDFAKPWTERELSEVPDQQMRASLREQLPRVAVPATVTTTSTASAGALSLYARCRRVLIGR